jgi:dipeptidyl-peptidase-3
MNTDEVAKAAYDSFIRNGLMTQLTRNPAWKGHRTSPYAQPPLIAAWCYNKGSQTM